MSLLFVHVHILYTRGSMEDDASFDEMEECEIEELDSATGDSEEQPGEEIVELDSAEIMELGSEEAGEIARDSRPAELPCQTTAPGEDRATPALQQRADCREEDAEEEGYSEQFLSGGEYASHAAAQLMEYSSGMDLLAMMVACYVAAATGKEIVNWGMHPVSVLDGPIPPPGSSAQMKSQMLVPFRKPRPADRLRFHERSSFVLPL